MVAHVGEAVKAPCGVKLVASWAWEGGGGPAAPKWPANRANTGVE